MVYPANGRVYMGMRLKSDNWWLRSPGNNNNNAAIVNNDGSVNSNGNTVNNNDGIRPDLLQMPERFRYAPDLRVGVKEPVFPSRCRVIHGKDKYIPSMKWTQGSAPAFILYPWDNQTASLSHGRRSDFRRCKHN